MSRVMSARGPRAGAAGAPESAGAILEGIELLLEIGRHVGRRQRQSRGAGTPARPRRHRRPPVVAACC